MWCAFDKWDQDVLGRCAHVEAEIGYFAGDRSSGVAPFLDRGGNPDRNGPIPAFPLKDALMAGPRTEFRVVVPPLRAELGVQELFPDWETQLGPTPAGAPRVTHVGSVISTDLVTGIGVELPTGKVVPFVDVLGVVHLVTADMEVDGVHGDWFSDSFSLAGRGGLRVQCSAHTYGLVAAEYAPIGPRTWGGTVGVGTAL